MSCNLYMVYILYTMIKGHFILWLTPPGNFNIYHCLLNDSDILLQIYFHDGMSSQTFFNQSFEIFFFQKHAELQLNQWHLYEQNDFLGFIFWFQSERC